MKRRNESGFSIVEILVVLVVIGAIALVGAWVFARQKSAIKTDKTLEKTSQKIDDSKPVLRNLGGVYLAAYNKNTGLAGDFKFDKSLIDPLKGIEVAFTFFGQDLIHAGQVTRVNPNLDMRGLVRQIDVLSAIDGKVVFIKQQGASNDYEIVLSKNDNSTWFVSYDHITDLKAKRGDTVVAGQVLGKAAPYRNGTFYYELQVNRKDSPNGDTLEYVCPTTLLDASVKPAYVEGLNLFARDWSDFRTKDVYGSQDGGCLKPVLKASEVDAQ
jgi:prepilin-type N-terminal cleavage/methylation domain-containing protein